MNIAIILAGGIGTRMGVDCPKQYIEINNRPIISYTMSKFGNSNIVDSVVIVADKEWQGYIEKWANSDLNGKAYCFALPGRTRQHSVYNGVKIASKIAKENDIIIIHDAARPMVSKEIINNCVEEAKAFGGAMPVIPVKDTVYRSKDGVNIDSLLNREEIYAGQAPEAFVLGQYLNVLNNASETEIENCRGTTEIAYKYDIKVKLFRGSVDNFKITDKDDLERFRQLVKGWDA